MVIWNCRTINLVWRGLKIYDCKYQRPSTSACFQFVVFIALYLLSSTSSDFFKNSLLPHRSNWAPGPECVSCWCSRIPQLSFVRNDRSDNFHIRLIDWIFKFIWTAQTSGVVKRKMVFLKIKVNYLHKVEQLIANHLARGSQPFSMMEIDKTI